MDRVSVKRNLLISGVLQNILNFCFFRNFLVFPSNIPQADQLPDGWVKGSVRILCDLQKTFQISGKLVGNLRIFSAVCIHLIDLGLLIGPGKKVRLHICQHSCQLTVYIVTCGIECF